MHPLGVPQPNFHINKNVLWIELKFKRLLNLLHKHFRKKSKESNRTSQEAIEINVERFKELLCSLFWREINVLHWNLPTKPSTTRNNNYWRLSDDPVSWWKNLFKLNCIMKFTFKSLMAIDWWPRTTWLENCIKINENVCEHLSRTWNATQATH